MAPLARSCGLPATSGSHAAALWPAASPRSRPAGAAAAAVAAAVASATLWPAPIARVRPPLNGMDAMGYLQQQQPQQQPSSCSAPQDARMATLQAPGRRQQQQPQQQQQQQQRGGAARRARQLTQRIMRSVSWQELAALLDAEGHAMNVVHMSAMLSRLGKLLRHAPLQQQQQAQSGTSAELERLEQFLQQLEAASLQLLSAVQVQEQGVLRVWRSMGPQLLVQQAGQAGRDDLAAAPQQLSTMAWGWAAAGFRPGGAWWCCYWVASGNQLGAYSSQELATAVWAAAKLQCHPPAGWTAAFGAASAAVMGAARPQELATFAWAAATLQLQLGAGWWDALRTALAEQQERLAPRDVAQVLWAHARLAAPPPQPWLEQLLAAMGGCLARFSGRDAAMLLWALAALQLQPPPLLLVGLLRELLASNCKLRHCAPQDFAHIMWSLAVFHRRQQQVPMQLAEHVGAERPLACDEHGSSSSCRSSRSGSSRRAVLPGGACQLDPQLASSWAAAVWHYTQPCRAGLAPADAAQLLWAARQLGGGWRPGRRWMGQLWAHSAPRLPSFGCQALVTTLWASVRLRAPPPRPWLLAAVPALQGQLAELAPAGACQLLYALAALRHRPNPAFMQLLLCRLQLDCLALQPRGYACVLWALSVLGYQPGATWWATILAHLEAHVDALGARETSQVLAGLRKLHAAAPHPALTAALAARAGRWQKESEAHARLQMQ